ncbi:hypothetical protein [Pantoea sp. ME81]|uniref:hypothetical protein n=1 Tax=Pantoea sp. ME81 TaxID=2743935 RepID=UPI0015F54831|nr:hypothetical protein [Pantoea sp. ME81]
MTKVETVIDTRLTALPALFQRGIAGLAHKIIFHQFKHEPFPFSVINRKRLDPRICALHSTLTFITMNFSDGQVIVNNEDCYGALKIICYGFMREMQTFLIEPADFAFVEIFTAPMIKLHFPELFN